MALFDDQGNEIAEEAEVIEEIPEETETEDAAEPEAEGKYVIGDKSFATQEEAFAYATSRLKETEVELAVTDAFRQGVAAATGATAALGNVTPAPEPEDDFDETEYFADPKAFLSKFKAKTIAEARNIIQTETQTTATAERIWSEFSNRHPELADFRADVESFVEGNAEVLRALIATKGQAAAYDYAATKVKAEFQRRADALKPKKVLSNGGGGASTGTAPQNVTRKVDTKKPLSFAEQLRSIKKGKR